MVQGGEEEIEAKISIVCPKEGASELGVVVSDDPVWDPKVTSDPLQELNCGASVNLGDNHGLGSLGELVDGDEAMLIAVDSHGEGPQDVEPPYHEDP